MSVAPRIEVRNLTLGDLFKEFYSVPEFQREYVWKKSNVEKLLQDITYDLYDEDLQKKDDNEYFLGSIVVFPDENGIYQLIDGQQRLTTIYLLFCIIRDCIHKSGEKCQTFEQLICGFSSDPNGNDMETYRLSLQYDSDGASLLKDIASKNFKVRNSPKDKLKSLSAENILSAYNLIKDFIEDKFENNPKQLREFSSLLSKQVKLIRIETANLKNALKVFETINERGVGLTSIDLLKNYLFMNTSKGKDINSRWEQIKEKWDKLTKMLYKHQEDPMRFLRYYLLSNYDVNLENSFPEEDVYEWFMSEGEKYGINNDPIKFVDKLISACEDYCNFLLGKNPDGTDNLYLKNIQKLKPNSKSRQHFILLIAGRHLNQELFTMLSRNIENLLFLYNITDKKRKNINIVRNFSQWGQVLRQVKNKEELKDFIQKYFQRDFNALNNDFELSFRELTDGNIGTYRLRYILSKIAQYIDEKAYRNSKPLDWYLSRNIHVEHILPKSENSEVIKDFDKPNEYKTYISKLGNLTLVEKTINSSISDKNYQHKKLGYRQSQILMTRSLVETPHLGDNTQLNRAVIDLNLEQFDDWNSNDIDKRQETLAQLAKKVWGIELDI